MNGRPPAEGALVWDGFKWVARIVGGPDGIASLDSNGTIPGAQLPASASASGPITPVTRQDTQTLSNTDRVVLLDGANSSPFTILLPPSPVVGQLHTLVIREMGVSLSVPDIYRWTIDGNGNPIKDGLSTYLTTTAGQSPTFFWNGTYWNVFDSPYETFHELTASTSYTTVATDIYVRVHTAMIAAPVSITLSDPARIPQRVVVKDTSGQAATYPITVSPQTGAFDGGVFSWVINQNYGCVIFEFGYTPNGNGGVTWSVLSSYPAAAGVSGYTEIQDEGVAAPQRNALDFQGSGVAVTDNGTKTIVTVPGISAVGPEIGIYAVGSGASSGTSGGVRKEIDGNTVLRWKFEETSAPFVNDGTRGTASNMAAVTGEGTNWQGGVPTDLFGRGLNFATWDASAGAIQSPHFAWSPTAMTWSIWFTPTRYTGQNSIGRIFFKAYYPSSWSPPYNGGEIGYYSGTADLGIGARLTASVGTGIVFGKNQLLVRTSVPHLIGFSIGAGTFTAYIDGRPAYTTSYSNPIDLGTGPWCIGQTVGSALQEHAGFILHEVRIDDIARDATWWLDNWQKGSGRP